ncbi:MAG: acetyl/propionyl/methylcrotonyl-CoA carboxylase subunit alpha [Actinomycetales bacterium]
MTNQQATRKLSKVLIANRGEIAVRVVRACADAGIASVAVYADQDANALHVRMADEAYALHGATPADTYLSIDKLLEVAHASGADAVHPGYGFLSENQTFAQAVLDAGLVWIGPPPSAIDALGDKVKARHIAERVGAPLVPGTPDPVSGAEDVVAFATEHGLPVAIKAAYGGGGRGIKVARTLEEIPELYESAFREAKAAFGHGECFVERFLEHPRHVETQCLADDHGNVVVVSTRDCSLQRRNQKLVEEAPAPFLTDDQNDELVRASKAILTDVGYRGAGTCEFLVGPDGTVTFLEVNTRLQVEHPVTEQVTGVDLVREQLRVAAGEPLSFTQDPPIVGHSFEFRINAEDAGRGFMPAPGLLTALVPPTGPGVRWDAGVVQGDEIAGVFDSMIAKLIVSGSTRQEALERSRRALAELVVEGLPTVVPFHREVVQDEAFAPADGKPFTVHTRWIETDFDNQIAPYEGAAGHGEPTAARQKVMVEVDGKRLEVTLPAELGMGTGAPAKAKAPRRAGSRAGAAGGAGSGALTAPMQGTIVKVVVAEGDVVESGALVTVIEAMKMEQPLNAHKAGRITGLEIEPGQTVQSGAVICTIEDVE